MKRIVVWMVLALCVSSAAPLAQQAASPVDRYNRPGPVGPIQGEKFHTQYIWLAQNADGLLYEPAVIGPKARTALVMAQAPNSNILSHPVGREMASRGYRVLIVTYRGEALLEAPLPTISRAISYVRALPDVQRAIVIGHSGGGRQMLLYTNVAEHGPAACQGPEKIYPCRAAGLSGLQKPDGLIVLDAPPGALHTMSGLDPAVEGGKGRNPALDMFAPANGYDPAAKRATYSPSFTKAYYAAQAVRNARIVGQALDRLKAINEGKGDFSDDEPLFIPGLPSGSFGTRLYGSDTHFLSHTKKPHLLIAADGSERQTVLTSVRPPVGQDQYYAEIFGVQPPSPEALQRMNSLNVNTSVRRFLANDAVRTTPDYAITEDDIVGVDWHSAYTEPVANAEGVSVPTLVEANTCHYSLVLGELVFDHLAAKDKTYVGLEGATHDFTPCRPQYGDTMSRFFDFLDRWLSKEGRF